MSLHLKRIATLAKYWESVDPATVDLSTWRCCTFACLAGHACNVPEFKAEGFGFDKWNGRPEYQGEAGMAACRAFFKTEKLFLRRNGAFEYPVSDCQLEATQLREYEYSHFMSDYQLAATRLREYLYERGIK